MRMWSIAGHHVDEETCVACTSVCARCHRSSDQHPLVDEAVIIDLQVVRVCEDCLVQCERVDTGDATRWQQRNPNPRHAPEFSGVEAEDM